MARGSEQGAWPCIALRRPVSRAARQAVATEVQALVAWQRDLSRWPRPSRSSAQVPDATPFVSIYAGGALRGCFGVHEGDPRERLVRTFLRSLEDSRYGMVRQGERDRLDVVVSYVRELRVVRPESLVDQVEPGTDGLAIVWTERAPVMLLPSVARDQHVGAAELLTLLLRKAGVNHANDATVFALRTDDVVVRSSPAARGSRVDARSLAVRWLEGMVGLGGEVMFAIDARRRARLETGTMHHGRAAVLVRALQRHGSKAAPRARAWLARSIAAALGGEHVAGWPTDPAMISGTLALAHLAGLDVEAPLRERATDPALAAAPWHAAQVAFALGRKAPASLWNACVTGLDVQPWAPWTLLAARARSDRDDRNVVGRVSKVLAESIRAAAPHAGGCSRAAVPEIALTALVVEALDGLPGAACRAAVTRARAFLSAWQLVPASIPASLDPALALGAFAASPIVVDHLRCDITAHALLALGPR